MTLYDYKQLIGQLPTREQAFVTKKTTWEKSDFLKNKSFSCFFDEHFKDASTIKISRQDCYNEKDNFSNLLFSTIFWGYPAGMRGNTFLTILKNELNIRTQFDKHIFDNKILTFDNLESLEKGLRNTGIGLSTLTKLLYFKQIDIDNYPAVVYDSRIIEILNSAIFEDFKNLTGAKKNTLSFYNFLVSVNGLSELNCQPEQIEHFLFAFGLNLKR